MKSSLYNMYFKLNENHVIFNTLSSKLLKVEEHIFHNIKNNIDINKIEKRDVLQKMGVIVAKEIDEVKLFKHVVDTCIYDNNLRMTVVMTNNCNFRCQYCYQDKNNKGMSDEVENSIIKYVKKNIANYKSLYIEWFGGEPLVEKKRLLRMGTKIKEICQVNRVPFISSITTNGYYLDLDTFNQLLDINCIYFQVTIDGIKELHDELRPHVSGKGTFDRITNNLLRIKNMEGNRRFTLAIRNNILKSQIKAYASFFDYFNETFSDDHRFKLIQKGIKDWGGDSVKKISNDLLESDTELLQFIQENESKLYGNTYSDLYEGIANKMCYAFKKNGFAIDWDGSVYKCNKNIENHRIRKQNLLGIIQPNGTISSNEPVQSLWVDKNLEDKCNTCELLPVCFTSGCPASWIMNKKMTCMKENKEDQHFAYTIEKEIKQEKFTTV